jgi:glycosyltransferase involved in cell wall biosynthesis
VISSADPRLGGPIEGVRRIAECNYGRGHETELVCADDPNAGFLKDFPFRVHALGRGLGKYSYQSRLVPWLRDNCQKFDAVIVNGIWQYHSFATWRAMRGSRVPYFVFPHGMLDPWFKVSYPAKHFKKLVYWTFFESRVLTDACAVLFTCEEERRLARQSFARYRCREVVTGYGTAPIPEDPVMAKGAFLSSFPKLADRRIVLFLSRIHEKKGCDLLIDAFADVCTADSRLHLVMAGPGDPKLVAGLKELAKQRGAADKITWIGMVQGLQKWGAIAAAEVFCLPSHQENFGIAVAEALSAGTPVLISNRVNIWREVEASGAGFVSEDTKAGVRANLDRWLAQPADAVDRMKQAARQAFDTHFRVDRVAQRLVDLVARAKDLTSSRKGQAREAQGERGGTI